MKLLKKLLLIGQLCLCTTLMAQTIPALPAVQTFVKPNATKYRGLFNIYQQEDKYYLEIPDTLLNRDILAMVVINKGSAQVSRDTRRRFGFAGDVVHESTFKFNKSKKGVINMEQSQFYMSPNDKSTYEATLKNKLTPIVASFVPVAKNEGSTLIDITASLNSDMHYLSLSGAKEELGLGPYQANLSRPIGIAAYKNNIVFRSVRAYGAGSATPKPQSITPTEPQQPAQQDKQMNGPTMWEIGASWYLLPAQPMRQRLADKRVGYFTRVIKDYGQDLNKAEDRLLAARWKIEPKSQDIEKYKRGELVEPAEPIVFYVDKNTPEYLRPYFIAGVNAWQGAFEKIGFKNAIMAKMEPTPEENPDFSIDNASYSVISYKPSTTANAYGPMVVDPRSGQIISSHVAVFHNITDLLQRWYFIMCAANDPEARKLPLSQDIMGRLMKMVITHEVGHTLGLRHDFAGSHSYDVDSVRKRSFVAKHGFGASIMDYLRFNYVAQPEDGFTAEELLPKIGIYDEYAIEWGYKYFSQYKTVEQEAEALKNWVSQKRKDPKYFYFPEGDFFDPRVQSEDMGSNAMKAGTLGIKNLKLIMQNLEAWLENDDDENYTMMKRMHSAVASRYNEYLAHVLKNIGGRYADQALMIEEKTNYQPVGRATQKEAMTFINDYYFQEPTWLFPENVVDKTRFAFSGPVAADYETFLGKVFFKFSAISRNERIVGQETYAVSEFFDDIYKGIFMDLDNSAPISDYKKMLQRGYVNKLLSSVFNPASYDNDVAIILKQQIEKIKDNCDMALQKKTDTSSKAHLSAITAMIEQWKGKKPTS
ncbi:zinc-dependent metalloprotease [Pedobacter sp.]|uniref:zinc-dependent metalloprotease n=1 Tax=Pedobacter sp. TaxID=1411316 RepID=UPI0031D70AF8